MTDETIQRNCNMVLPIDLRDFILENCELYCSCGCYVNEHDNGICNNSICENECGCVSCEFDYDLSVMMHYFQGFYDRTLVTRLTSDVSKIWGSTHHGIPYLKEPYQMTVTRHGCYNLEEK